MSHAPSPALSRRHQIVRSELASRGLDALVITSLPNILYLTNFTGSSAIVVLTADASVLHHRLPLSSPSSNDARGTPHECPDLELVTVEGSYDATLAQLLAQQPWRRIGFEAAHLTVDRYRWLTATIAADGPIGAELVATERIVERARVRKDPYEIATLREAARRLSLVAAAIPADVVRGLHASATSRWRSIDASGGRASSGRRLIRLSPAAPTRRCRTRVPESEQLPKATSWCWTSAASTTHTAST